jgi:hypothetical protein
VRCALLALTHAGLGLEVAPARAQVEVDCGDARDPLEQLQVQPPDMAEGVALDAPIVVRYARDVDLAALQASLDAAGGDACQTTLVCLFEDASAQGKGARETVPGRVEVIDSHTVIFVPDATLRAHTRYFSSIARAGFDRPTRDELEFESGAHKDREAPVMTGDKGAIELSVGAPPAECRTKPGSVRVALVVPRATDDGDESSVELLLFSTRVAGAKGPVLRVRARNPDKDAGKLRLSFLLDPREAKQPACVALRAVDGVGRLSKAAPELCFDPLRGSFFAPCAVLRAPGAAGGLSGDGRGRSLVAFSFVVAAALFARRRGHRTRPA